MFHFSKNNRMKKRVKIFMVFSGVLLLTNCMPESEYSKNNMVYFLDEPAQVESLDTELIRSAHGIFKVFSLKNTPLETGNLLWTSFTVDMNEASHSDYYTAIDFHYQVVDSAKVIIPFEPAEFRQYLSDSYTEPIHEAVLYKDYLDKLLFFGFRKGPLADNSMSDYEIILNPEKENGHPTFYIRSKKTGTTPSYTHTVHESHGKRDETVFAFDMTEFIAYYEKHISNTGSVWFNLKYKVGEDNNGNDIYREFRDNPIRWNVKSGK
jgi:hypothetical protein